MPSSLSNMPSELVLAANTITFLINYIYSKRFSEFYRLRMPSVTLDNSVFNDGESPQSAKGFRMCQLRVKGFNPDKNRACRDERISGAVFIDFSVIEDAVEIVRRQGILSFSSNASYVNHAISRFKDQLFSDSVVDSFRAIEDCLKLLVKNLDSSDFQAALASAKSDSSFKVISNSMV